jgi:glycine/serine hydroxymethyltransferase
MAEEDQTPTRPYTVLEPRDLGDLVEELLGSKVAPEIASKAVAALREEQFEVYQSRGTFQARQVGHALRQAAKDVFGGVGCDTHMTAVVSERLKTRPVKLVAKSTVSIG